MKNISYLFLFILLSACNSPENHTQERDFYAGAAAKNITPGVGMFIAGDAQNRMFTGIHDSLYVKAVVLKQGDHAVAIVTLNCIGFLHPDIQKIREKGAQLSQIVRAEEIVVTSDHIHSGPDVVGIWGPSQGQTGRDSVYLDFLIDQAAIALKEASENIQLANAYTATGEFGEGWVNNISIPDEIDRSLTILQLTDNTGSNIATLTNFACHPTFYDAVHTEVSADYVGAFVRDMESSMPGQHLFIQGAIGGWVQPDKGDQSFATGQMRGKELSAAVQGLLSRKKQLDSTSIEVRNATFEMPVSNPGWQQLADLGVIDREIGATTQSEMVWFRIGPAQFITHPGETSPQYSLESKSMMSTSPRFVIGLGMDAMGYILKPEFFGDNPPEHAAYLTRMSPGPEAGPMVMKTAKELMY